MHKQQIAYRLVMAALFLGAFSYADYTKDSKTGEPEWMKLTKPSEGHKVLNDTVGKWKYTMQWWQAPGAKPEESKGTSTNKWTLDGRFLQQDIKGKAMGKKFVGVGYTGFDNMTQEYRSTWMDNMSTHLMVMDGKWDAEKKTLTSTGKGSDPMAGVKDKPFRSELRIENKNSHYFAMFDKDKDGNEFKSMEIHYTRKK